MSRAAPRAHAPATYNSVKTAWKRLVQDLGGVAATAACTRASLSLASDYGSVASDRFCPADMILDAEFVGGTPHVTAALARAQGYELVPTVPQDDSQLAALVARLGRDTAALFADAVAAIEAGTVPDALRQRLVVELEAIRHDANAGISMLVRRHAP